VGRLGGLPFNSHTGPETGHDRRIGRMNAIINGKRYDTDTARKIGSASYGYGRDFGAWEEALHVTQKGAYFTAGSGGPMTSYARRVDSNTTSGGSAIRVLSRTEAAEIRELRKRNRLLEQENEVLRRAAAYLSQANLPGKGSTRS